MDIFQIDSEFKKNVGDFILTFSEIEFSLSIILSKLENGLDVNPLIPEIFGTDFSVKRNRIRKAILNNNSLLKKWDKLNRQLGECNEFRRSIAHGIVMNHIVHCEPFGEMIHVKNCFEVGSPLGGVGFSERVV